MKPAEIPKYAVTAAFVVLILVLIVTQLLGQPAIVFVETGSMAPTLQPNDGFVAIPSMFVDDVDEGDVIVFEAQEIGGGGLTTHRVVGETEQGYITRGDANPFTDQEGDEPPVTEGQIRSVALQVNGELVVIPGLGATVKRISATTGTFQRWLFAVLGLDAPGVPAFSVGVLTVGLLMLLYSFVVGTADERTRKRSGESPLRNGLVIITLLTLMVLLPLNFSMLLPSGVYQYDIISSESPSEQQRVIEAGGSTEVTYFVRNSGHIPVLVFLEPASTGVDIPEDRRRTYVPRRTTINATVTIHAPAEPGAYPRFVREQRYLVVLPPSLIATLHRIHPFLAIGVINAFVGAVMIVVGVVSVGTDRVRLRSRSRDVPDRGRVIRRVTTGIGGTIGDRSARRTGPSSTPPTEGSPEPTAAPTPGVRPEAGGSEQVPSDRLSPEQLAELSSTLRRPPDSVGLESTRWTPQTLQQYIESEYGHTYPRVRCAWLLDRAGIEPDGTEKPGDTSRPDSGVVEGE